MESLVICCLNIQPDSTSQHILSHIIQGTLVNNFTDDSFLKETSSFQKFWKDDDTLCIFMHVTISTCNVNYLTVVIKNSNLCRALEEETLIAMKWRKK